VVVSDGVTWRVRRHHWRRLTTDPVPRYVRLPGAVSVAAFDDRHEAEADCWRRELAVRERVNPFHCGLDLADLTHLPAYAFKDYLLDDSVRPAKYDSTAQIRWDKWWEKNSPGWNFDRTGRIWEVLDKVRFFEVAERVEGAELFVAVEAVAGSREGLAWDRDVWNLYRIQQFGIEGGRPVRAFRSSGDARACCDLAAEATDQLRRQPDTDPFTTEVRALLPADRVYDVPFAGELSADRPTVFVVCRVGLRLNTEFHTSHGWEFDEYETGELRWVESVGDFCDAGPHRYAVRLPRLVPEAAFVTREDADADCHERERTAEQTVNPYFVREFGGERWTERAARAWAANAGNAPVADCDVLPRMVPRTMYQVVELPWE
jgi:hypothetical protein